VALLADAGRQARCRVELTSVPGSSGVASPWPSHHLPVPPLVDRAARSGVVSGELGRAAALGAGSGFAEGDSPRDREATKQLLGALIRERAPRANGPPKPVPADVQAALTVLGRREPAASNYIERPVDLRGVQLHGADLDNARLAGIDLSGADLSGTKMTGVKQQSEQIREGLTILWPVSLAGANLSYAYIPVANLK
jgi:uncharacterized protein YjbI with pentapeptide repeats